MDAADKRMLEREALRNMIQQWNANRLDLFELSEPNENLEFHGVMRFYFQDSGQKIATKCIRVASDATVSDVIETLIEKFRPDMRMLSLGSYSLWETHAPNDERRLEAHEKPLLVQLNWHADDREGRFLLKCTNDGEIPLNANSEKSDQNFKRKLSKREKKELKKKEKLSRIKSDAGNDANRPVAEKLYTELPETSFTRSISNPEAVMRRRRQQKLERKLQQFRSRDGGPDTGGTLKIYGSSLCGDVPYKTLLLSVGDTAACVVREMLDKYGLSRHDPQQYCIVQVNTVDNSECILEDDECPLAIVMTHQQRGSIMFHVRRRPADSQPRRRKKKVSGSGGAARPGAEPLLVEVSPDGGALDQGRRLRLTDVLEVGSGNGMSLQLYGPSIQSRHCVIAATDGAFCLTPLHADAHVFVNNQRVTHTVRLQHGSLIKFGRVATFRFVDPLQENILNRNLSQSQHFGSGSLYDRSEHDASGDTSADYRATSPVSNNRDSYSYKEDTPYNNNTLKLDNESLALSQHFESKDDLIDETPNNEAAEHNSTLGRGTQSKDNYETTFDLDGNVETKSVCSVRSGGSPQDRSQAVPPTARVGQEAILPAVLEFPEAGQQHFLAAVITRLDPHAPAFKLAPVYTLYLCARYRASTHYRPELTPTERAHKLTALLHHVATLIHATVQEKYADSAAQAFWMANSSELLHFLKCDRHISTFSTQAQELLTTTVHNSFSNLVSCFQEELTAGLGALTARSAAEPHDAAAPALQCLTAAMVLLRRCRVNAALTIQLFSHLFHYINAVCFNKLVTEPGAWGGTLASRLTLLGAWAERQGLELAADCHLARVHQANRLIQSDLRTPEEVRAALSACFKLNSVQVRALLAPLNIAPDLLELAVQHARALADQLYRADGREIAIEESPWLGVGLLIPGDGFSAEVVRGVPPGLAEFLAPLQRAGLCRLAHQPHAIGAWTVYIQGFQSQVPRTPKQPRVQLIQLHKNSNGMGLSIVAAKGVGQSRLGIYIKSVVAGGAAAADGRLAAGDQLLSVDGHSLVGITQEKAAEYLVRTGPTVTLEVAKQGAVLHGLATLLHQPTPPPNQRQGTRRASERDLPSRLAAEPVKPSKSVPALHHATAVSPPPPHNLNTTQPLPTRAPAMNGVSPAATTPAWVGKSRSSHNLTAPPHDLYQNLTAVNNDRWSSLRSSTSAVGRPQSAHYNPHPDMVSSPPEQHYPGPHGSNVNVRAAKFAELTEEVNRRQLHQQQLQQQQLQQHYMQQHPMSPLNAMSPGQHMSPGQPMSPLMSGQPMSPLMSGQPLSPGQPMSPPISGQPMLPGHPMSPGQPLSSGQPMSPLMNQNQISGHTMSQTLMMAGQPMSPMMSGQPMSPPQQIPQRYDWQPPGPPSPQRHQPAVAPKPQGVRRSELDGDAHSSSNHHSAVQPDEDSYIASAMEPPGVSAYGGEGASATNPWAREEREREAETRRAAARARRDANIAALQALGHNRTPHQNQQLRALQLERDFERRANQANQEENDSTPERVQPAPNSAVMRYDADAPPPPPKSILKRQDNDRDQPYAEETSRVNNAATSLSALVLEPPPPPERGSSFAAMSRHLSPAPPATSPPPPRDKRVSFHEQPPPAPTTAPPDTDDEQQTTPTRREDPDRFIEEAENMLATPTTPTTPTSPGVPSHTPGVIGAQEVYRDPRQRRLAEQQARAAAAGAREVPETLSFKEKMKMFALETGENNTPKDKVKISRAQRDIDAVH